jgi:DoxX-like family
MEAIMLTNTQAAITQAANTQPATVSNAALWAGGIVTVLVVAFLAFDGVAKILKTAPVMKASEELGLSPQATVGIGIVLLACSAIYAVPQTAVLGAILLTAHLGGATAIHVRAGSGAFPVVFSIAFGVLVWVGLVLREPRLLWTILLRQ